MNKPTRSLRAAFDSETARLSAERECQRAKLEENRQMLQSVCEMCDGFSQHGYDYNFDLNGSKMTCGDFDGYRLVIAATADGLVALNDDLGNLVLKEFADGDAVIDFIEAEVRADLTKKLNAKKAA